MSQSFVLAVFFLKPFRLICKTVVTGFQFCCNTVFNASQF